MTTRVIKPGLVCARVTAGRVNGGGRNRITYRRAMVDETKAAAGARRLRVPPPPPDLSRPAPVYKRQETSKAFCARRLLEKPLDEADVGGLEAVAAAVDEEDDDEEEEGDLSAALLLARDG